MKIGANSGVHRIYTKFFSGLAGVQVGIKSPRMNVYKSGHAAFFVRLALASISLPLLGASAPANPNPPAAANATRILKREDDAATTRARAVLHQIVAQERSWIQIHAAEALIATGESAAIRAIFVSEQAKADLSDYRIGAWRVRANTAESTDERSHWIGRIEKVFHDPTSPDRLDAIESLSKLGFVVTGQTRAMVRTLAAEASEGDALFALWALALAGEPGALERMTASLASANGVARQRAAYAFRWLRPKSAAILQALARGTNAEPPDTDAYPYLLSAALLLNADPQYIAAWQAKLEKVLATGETWARYEASQSLMPRYGLADLPRLLPLLEHSESDTRIGAAWSILYICARAGQNSPGGVSRP